jgi:ribonuclease VapC
MVKVFDSSAVLAFLFDEPGAEKVRSALSDSDGAGLISAVNAGEVLLVLVRAGMSLDGATDALCMVRLTPLPFSLSQAAVVGGVGFFLRSRKHGLSLGDYACIATALHRDVPVVTADRIWADLQIPNLQIELIR